MTTMYEARVMTAPEVYPEHEVYWEAAADNELLLKKCTDCSEYHHYPRTFCPYCHSEHVDWVKAQGLGTIYTYTIMRVGKPYAMAFVELNEGPRIMTNIVDCDFDQLHIGQQVEVIFKQSGTEEAPGAAIVCFTPVE